MTRRRLGAGFAGYPEDAAPPPMHRAVVHEPVLRAFIDTSVLVAAVDPSDPDRRMLARGVIGPDAYLHVVTSAQVLVEFHRAVRALTPPVDERLAVALVRELARDADVMSLTGADVVAALRLTTAALDADPEGGEELRMRDMLIVRSAQVAGCDVLLTTALADGRRFDGLVVEDPFA